MPVCLDANSGTLRKKFGKCSKKNEVIFVNGTADYYGGKYKITIHDFSLPPESVDMSELVPSEPIDVDAVFNEIFALVYQMENPILKKATIGVLGEYGESFKVVSAAKRMHHYKRGGLLRHVKEMLDLALFVQKMYPTANKETFLLQVLFITTL